MFCGLEVLSKEITSKYSHLYQNFSGCAVESQRCKQILNLSCKMAIIFYSYLEVLLSVWGWLENSWNRIINLWDKQVYALPEPMCKIYIRHFVCLFVYKIYWLPQGSLPKPLWVILSELLPYRIPQSLQKWHSF